jgi:DNA-binding IclR family transcriptional regulator
MLSRRAGDRTVAICHVDSDKMLLVNMAVADNLPLDRSSFGKLHLALASRAKTKSGRVFLSQDEISTIGRSRYAISRGEVERAQPASQHPFSRQTAISLQH